MNADNNEKKKEKGNPEKRKHFSNQNMFFSACPSILST
jgi:hypothetical protein